MFASASLRTRRTRCRRRCSLSIAGDDAGRHRSSIHLGESPEEVEFLRHGGGPIAERAGSARRVESRLDAAALRAGGVHRRSSGCCPSGCWPSTACSSPTVELAQLAAAGATLVTCPRSNRWVGAGSPPVDAVLRVRRARRDRHRQPGQRRGSQRVRGDGADPRAGARTSRPGRLLDSATRIGAEALGFGDDFGTIEPGKRAALIAVRVPDGVDDVEEYLVSGIRPADVGWLDEPGRPRVPRPEPRAPKTLNPVNRLSTYASFVRFSHSVFALPFALTGALLALHQRRLSGTRSTARSGARGCGSSWRWSRRAARRWDSTGWSTRATTR